jgi:plasmid stabilization system protein ParE
MYTLEITASAEADLNQITDYLGNTLANPPAALAVLDEVDRVSDTLEETPELFPLCADSRLAELGYRKAIIRAYILVYEIDRQAQVVRVLRFFHESENYSGKL